MEEKLANYIKEHQKEQMAGFLLTFFAGPLGLFYSSWPLAIILTIIAVVTLSTFFVPLGIWLFSIIWSYASIHDHNKKLESKVRLMMG